MREFDSTVKKFNFMSRFYYSERNSVSILINISFYPLYQLSVIKPNCTDSSSIRKNKFYNGQYD